MKVSLINPSPNSIEDTTMVDACPPLGILYIASVLRNSGVNVSALDMAAEHIPVEKTIEWVVREDPDFLGLSTLLSSNFTALKIAEEVKKRLPDTKVVFGNHFATFSAERILDKYLYVDIVVRGEGEEAFRELIDAANEDRPLGEVSGISYRKNGSIASNPDRALTKDIDSIPFPARDLMDCEYHNATLGVNVAPKKFTSFLSSRGCAFSCRFCSCTKMGRNRWRPRSNDNIMEELHLLSSEGYRQIMFVDDSFTLDQKRVTELCRRMRKERIDMEWICEGRVDHCSYEMLREMVKAGCIMMYFGIESANQKALDYYNKRITPEQSVETVSNARKAGVDITVGSFIVGAPNETREEIQNTLDFTKKIDVDIPQINILGAFPGNLIWEELKESGRLDEEQYWETGVLVPEIVQSIPLEVIRQMIKDYYQDFLKRPSYALKQLILTTRSGYRRNIIRNNIGRIDQIKRSFSGLY